MTPTICVDCTLRIANDQDPICDGSGVIAITDWPSSRVVVCPEWPIDEDEPTAYWVAINGLAYDAIPPTMQQRIRDNLMAQIVASDNVNCEPLDEHTYVSADFLAHVDRVRRNIWLIGLAAGVIAAVLVAGWAVTR